MTTEEPTPYSPMATELEHVRQLEESGMTTPVSPITPELVRVAAATYYGPGGPNKDIPNAEGVPDWLPQMNIIRYEESRKVDPRPVEQVLDGNGLISSLVYRYRSDRGWTTTRWAGELYPEDTTKQRVRITCPSALTSWNHACVSVPLPSITTAPKTQAEVEALVGSVDSVVQSLEGWVDPDGTVHKGTGCPEHNKAISTGVFLDAVMKELADQLPGGAGR